MSKRHAILVVVLGLMGAAAIVWRDVGAKRGHRLVDDYHDRPAVVDNIKADSKPIDILLLGDSIMGGWGRPERGTMNSEWKRRFGIYKSTNAGVAGAKAEHLLLQLN